ncbi:hypothetical protein [uncultured Aquimarina sp.]|uniref:hypothetical protein n=1 Tax=uncultured Aquimarina sp. TaxID=575652 RepID=UPI002632048C|nr:hypothetical protein [uncultured Aquimarina sp.]
MDKEILDIIDKDFAVDFREFVIKELSSIELKHVMAESEYNLKNTKIAILYLAQGNIDEVIELTKQAKIDFRDVIMWATQEKKSKDK